MDDREIPMQHTGSGRRGADSGEQTLERRYEPAQRDPLDVSDIPTPEDIAQGKTERARKAAAEILGEVRTYIAEGRVGAFHPRPRGGTIPEGALALVNASLAPRGWKVESCADPRENDTTYSVVSLRSRVSP